MNPRGSASEQTVPLYRGRVARIVPEFWAQTTPEYGATPCSQRNSEFFARGAFCLFYCCTSASVHSGSQAASRQALPRSAVRRAGSEQSRTGRRGTGIDPAPPAAGTEAFSALRVPAASLSCEPPEDWSGNLGKEPDQSRRGRQNPVGVSPFFRPARARGSPDLVPVPPHSRQFSSKDVPDAHVSP